MPRRPSAFFKAALALAALGLALPGAFAQEGPHGGARPAPPGAAEPARPPAASLTRLVPADAVTHHEMTLGGAKLAYTATAGTLPLRDAHGEVGAQIFYVSFTLDNAQGPTRPITYVFNGGPGAASAYLDIGALGPRALDFGQSGAPSPQPDHVVDNPGSWLPFTDLVFIDPVGTGYSLASGGAEAAAKQYWGVSQDLAALGDAIRLHLTRSGRLTSPVYLAGESYGGFRAARLAHDLPSEEGIAPAGVLLISPAIEFRLLSGDALEPLAAALRLPSYAVASLAEAGKLTPEARASAEQFALHEYLTAMIARPRDGAAAQALYAKVAQLTGLDVANIARWHGLVPVYAYLKDSRRRENQVVSRYDATVGGIDAEPLSPQISDDPVLDATKAPFSTGFVAYARDELGFKTDLPFEILNGDVSRHWDWGSGRGGQHSVGAADALGRALALQPKLRVMIANGLTDLITPYMTSRYIAAHLPDAEQQRVALKLYEGGHMFYLRQASRAGLHADAKAFYAAATAE